ncbi:hypothetical protein KBD18_01180 [Patescibacteria group bacterium]|nr:hypothetical protein [Patescibacteria group bacterium]
MKKKQNGLVPVASLDAARALLAVAGVCDAQLHVQVSAAPGGQPQLFLTLVLSGDHPAASACRRALVDCGFALQSADGTAVPLDVEHDDDGGTHMRFRVRKQSADAATNATAVEISHAALSEPQRIPLLGSR